MIGLFLDKVEILMAITKLKPIVKWAGGKEQELKYIQPKMPKKFNNYFEPFVGGGAVYFNIGIEHKKFINDKSDELINLYKSVANEDSDFLEFIEEIIEDWFYIETYVATHSEKLTNIYSDFFCDLISDIQLKKLVSDFLINNHDLYESVLSKKMNLTSLAFKKEVEKSLPNKMIRMKAIELKKSRLPETDILHNIEGAIKAAYYMHLRNLYNTFDKLNISKSFYEALFFFIRNYTYSGMFRYNSSGKFNVPYGGIGYNRKSLNGKLSYMKSKTLISYLKDTEIFNLDFQKFFDETKPNKDDFIFLDPPYDSEFSTYAKNEFTKDDQMRLADYLINKCNAKWMIVIKNTPFIYSLYNSDKLNISSFSKKYLVSFRNRNDKNAEHLLIKNYD